MQRSSYSCLRLAGFWFVAAAAPRRISAEPTMRTLQRRFDAPLREAHSSTHLDPAAHGLDNLGSGERDALGTIVKKSANVQLMRVSVTSDGLSSSSSDQVEPTTTSTPAGDVFEGRRPSETSSQHADRMMRSTTGVIMEKGTNKPLRHVSVSPDGRSAGTQYVEPKMSTDGISEERAFETEAKPADNMMRTATGASVKARKSDGELADLAMHRATGGLPSDELLLEAHAERKTRSSIDARSDARPLMTERVWPMMRALHLHAKQELEAGGLHGAVSNDSVADLGTGGDAGSPAATYTDQSPQAVAAGLPSVLAPSHTKHRYFEAALVESRAAVTEAAASPSELVAAELHGASAHTLTKTLDAVVSRLGGVVKRTWIGQRANVSYVFIVIGVSCFSCATGAFLSHSTRLRTGTKNQTTKRGRAMSFSRYNQNRASVCSDGYSDVGSMLETNTNYDSAREEEDDEIHRTRPAIRSAFTDVSSGDDGSELGTPGWNMFWWTQREGAV